MTSRRTQGTKLKSIMCNQVYSSILCPMVNWCNENYLCIFQQWGGDDRDGLCVATGVPGNERVGLSSSIIFQPRVPKYLSLVY